jgi:hypothetical protein
MLPCNLPPFETPGFLSWFVYAAGLSKVPPQFTLWAGLSALSACMSDRIWFSKFRNEKLYANLYVMLIGPSGTGKNQAWRQAQKLVEKMPSSEQEIVQLYRGKSSAEALISWLGKSKKRNNIWLVTPELALQVGNGPKAESFITHMTELFDGDQTFQDNTRTSGHHTVRNPIIGWGSGTTQDWLLRSVGKQDVLGGFFARICAIPAERSSVRYAKVIYPHDAAEIEGWLSAYLAHLTQITGEFTLDDAADEYHTWWYENRAEPENDLLWHYYEHGDNIVYKLCMVLAASDSYKLVGEYDHMVGAIALYEWVYDRLGKVLEFAHQTPEVEKLEMIARYIEALPAIGHAQLLRAMSARGVTREVLMSNLQTLKERGDVTQLTIGAGRSYRWIGT